MRARRGRCSPLLPVLRVVVFDRRVCIDCGGSRTESRSYGDCAVARAGWCLAEEASTRRASEEGCDMRQPCSVSRGAASRLTPPMSVSTPTGASGLRLGRRAASPPDSDASPTVSQCEDGRTIYVGCLYLGCLLLLLAFLHGVVAPLFALKLIELAQVSVYLLPDEHALAPLPAPRTRHTARSAPASSASASPPAPPSPPSASCPPRHRPRHRLGRTCTRRAAGAASRRRAAAFPTTVTLERW